MIVCAEYKVSRKFINYIKLWIEKVKRAGSSSYDLYRYKIIIINKVSIKLLVCLNIRYNRDSDVNL